MKITISKWRDHNPRTDLKTMAWFRLAAGIGTERKLHGLGPDQKWLWIFLLDLSAEENSPTFDVDVTYIVEVGGVASDRVRSAIDRFVKKEMITVEFSPEDWPHAAAPAEPVTTTDGPVTNPYGSVRDTPPHPDESDRGRSAERTGTVPTDGTDGTDGTDTTDKTNNTGPRPSARVRVDPEDAQLAAHWLQHAQSVMPWKDAPKGWTLERFTADVGRLRRRAGLTSEGIGRVMAWAFADDFWRDKCLSPDAMAGKSGRNGQSKMDNVLLAFKRTTAKHDDAMAAAEAVANGTAPPEWYEDEHAPGAN